MDNLRNYLRETDFLIIGFDMEAEREELKLKKKRSEVKIFNFNIEISNFKDIERQTAIQLSMLSVKITSKKIAITDINKAYETSSSDKYILNAAINLLKSERDHYTIKIRSSKAKGIDLKKEIDRVRSDIADNESLSRTTKNDFVCRRNLIELKQQMESLSSNYREIEIDLQLLESRKVINDAEIRSQESKLSLLVQRIDFIMANLRVETSELNSYHLQNQNLNSSIIGIRKELASRQELLRSEQSTLNGIELNIAKLPREDCLTRSSNFRKTF